MLNFPINDYPTQAETDPNVLYRSLGSFWTQIFQDRDILKGYTIGQAEEAIQRYYDLIEVINSYSVHEVPVFHTEKWKPISILKSKFGNEPFVFEPNGAVFGPQSSDDKYYQDVVFQFGFPKKPAADVYLFNVGASLTNFGVITDRVINPSTVLFNGSDTILVNGTLYFNRDLFADPLIPKLNIVAENGDKVQFTNTKGELVDEQLIVLWAYHAKIDNDILFNNFGYIFNLNRKNDQFFKRILEKTFDLYVDGPTIDNITSICAAFLGITPVVEKEESVEEIFNDTKYKYVVTDKNVYRFDTTHTIKPTLIEGTVVYAGDILVESISYYDNVQTPGWWKSSSVLKTKLALSQYLFLGNYESQLVVPNELDLVTLDSAGDIVFPISGAPKDVALFHSHLNASKSTIKPLLGLDIRDSVPIQPVDFLMENFLKTNTAFIKFKFVSNEAQSKFLSLLPILRAQLPPYIYVIFDLDMVIPNDSYSKLNGATVISFTSGDLTLNADGSNNAGYIESLAPFGYKNATQRLFALSLAIPAQEYEIVGTESSTAGSEFDDAKTEGRVLKMTDGAPLKSPPDGATTLTFNKLLLLDFT